MPASRQPPPQDTAASLVMIRRQRDKRRWLIDDRRWRNREKLADQLAADSMQPPRDSPPKLALAAALRLFSAHVSCTVNPILIEHAYWGQDWPSYAGTISISRVELTYSRFQILQPVAAGHVSTARATFRCPVIGSQRKFIRGLQQYREVVCMREMDTRKCTTSCQRFQTWMEDSSWYQSSYVSFKDCESAATKVVVAYYRGTEEGSISGHNDTYLNAAFLLQTLSL
ncbi:hypothetical protein GJ744_005408 [Endocarpon pusillum]|uniref:Uncharacterized protein n=1 Tax=Endocarpon pusillum TaxID=364733 RepID=A0A8H7DZL8_9EURO|nr:hypothetical protein GJ744_005408 [Endocarpon pusillum]